jgi:hypothetical protein
MAVEEKPFGEQLLDLVDRASQEGAEPIDDIIEALQIVLGSLIELREAMLVRDLVVTVFTGAQHVGADVEKVVVG